MKRIHIYIYIYIYIYQQEIACNPKDAPTQTKRGIVFVFVTVKCWPTFVLFIGDKSDQVRIAPGTPSSNTTIKERSLMIMLVIVVIVLCIKFVIQKSCHYFPKDRFIISFTIVLLLSARVSIKLK